MLSKLIDSFVSGVQWSARSKAQSGDCSRRGTRHRIFHSTEVRKRRIQRNRDKVNRFKFERWLMSAASRRTKEPLFALCKEIEQAGGEAHPYSLDARKEDQVNRVYKLHH